MNAIGNAIGLAWTIAAWWFIASVFAAPVFLAIRKARARGKRLFADEPTARVRALKSNTTNDHIWDA
jgi:hypothetical protein